MTYQYSHLIAAIESWTQQAVSGNWINQHFALSLLDEEKESASLLFSKDNARPLVVAFMGGTGVGKSSLLNKLAAQSIAKTGEERPTSREVTLYHHHSISIHQLEETFSLQQIRLSQHSKETNQNIIWIDMPDFDSTEQKNKAIVMQWLPFIDVLIYVVSPERYRDNKAWQLLLAKGANHAWLFVLNQWDKAESAQYEDFKQQLALAGFDNPLIYKTVCTEQMGDELPLLQTTIESLATEKTVKQLELRGMLQRKKKLQQKLQQGLQLLGNATMLAKLQKHQASSWLHTESILRQGFEWPVKQVSMTYSKTDTNLQQGKIKLWDNWAQSRFNDYLDDLIITADQLGLPCTPLRKSLSDCRSKAEKILHTQAELGYRQALIKPGNAVQRTLLKIANVGELMLPLVAMSIVGFQVFQGYYDSSFTDEAFLGVNFAVHSVLLISISWLLPFFIKKKMQPSMEKAALKGLHKGLGIAMTMIELEVKQVLNGLKIQHQEIITPLKKIIFACDEQDESMSTSEKSVPLNRMLVEEVMK